MDSRVDVPVMPSTTATTNPLSYYEVFSTFWAAAHTACGTDLRGHSLVNLDVFGSVPDGFVAELRSKLRPAGIEHGPGQAGPGQCTEIDVADADAPVAVCIPRDGKLLADRLHGVRVQPEELTATAGELDQIETRGPVPVVSPGGFLDLAAVVPDVVHRPSLSEKMPAGGRILDPVAIGQHHGNIVLDRCHRIKIDAKHFAGIFTPDFASAMTGITNMYGTMRLGGGLQDAHRRCSRIRHPRHRSATVKGSHRAPPPRPERRGFRRGEFR